MLQTWKIRKTNQYIENIYIYINNHHHQVPKLIGLRGCFVSFTHITLSKPTLVLKTRSRNFLAVDLSQFKSIHFLLI